MGEEVDSSLAFRSHYRVCMDICEHVPTKSEAKQKKDIKTEYVYIVRPLHDLLLDMIRLWDFKPDLKHLPLDIREKLAPSPSHVFFSSLHPCALHYNPPNFIGPCTLTITPCPNPFLLAAHSRNFFACLECDVAVCASCVRSYSLFRLSSTRQIRTPTSPLVIGSFSSIPTILTTPLPSIFSVPLLTQASNVLQFLAAAAQIHSLNRPEIVTHVLKERYVIWITLLKSNPNTVLVPPLDVEAVWFIHMLQSLVYKRFAEPLGISHRSHTWTLSLDQRLEAQSTCAKLWTTLTTEPFLLTASPRPPHPPTHRPPELRQDLLLHTWQVIADRDWYPLFVRATKDINVTSPAFFQRSLLGYQKFLYLLAKYPKTLQRISFAPSPPIDLIWHTHLLSPASYERDMTKLVFNVHHHHLIAREDRKMLRYEKDAPEEKIWREEFNESYAFYLSACK